MLKKAFETKRLGNSSLELRNVFIRSAAYEGMIENGVPTRELTEHHLEMVKGGVALTTVSYGAVSADGRTFKDQMYLNPETISALGILVSQIHMEGGKVSIQLTHCGYFSKNKDYKRPLAPSRVFNEYGSLYGIFFSGEMNRSQMERIAEDFANSAVEAKNAGFDAVEVHMGHGYLLSQFLSPLTNKRKDEYGGSLENRARYPLEVVSRVIKAAGPEFPVLVKLNMHDGKRKGFNTEECIYVAGELEKLGCAALVLSGGFTSKTPFYLMRGKVPLWGMIRNGSNFAEKLTMALFGPFIIKKYRFRENFFLDQARQVRQAVKIPLAYLGGIDSAEGISEVVDEGFEFVAIARALIHDPRFVNHLEDGSVIRSECTRCNRCVVEMDRKGVKCVLESPGPK